MKQWWLQGLTVTDRTNIACFLITIAISIICIVVLKKMKPQFMRFRIAWVLLMDVIGVALLVTRLTNG